MKHKTRETLLGVDGAGDAARRNKMVRQAGNFGDSRIWTPGQSGSGGKEEVVDQVVDVVDVYSLDTLFPQLPLPEPVWLMKLDVQGFECRALDGALSMLLAGSVQSIVAETSQMLKRQNCSAFMMQEFLRRAGYSIVSGKRLTANEVSTVARLNV